MQSAPKRIVCCANRKVSAATLSVNAVRFGQLSIAGAAKRTRPSEHTSERIMIRTTERDHLSASRSAAHGTGHTKARTATALDSHDPGRNRIRRFGCCG